ncbi:hypothetical protein AKO1_010133 [Acrasis kona]|uniref:Gustatory receptor n=1 Tax=Acrasis kona TaxID=1008807 RepID=A0AAW2ZTR4_9EUKA
MLDVEVMDDKVKKTVDMKILLPLMLTSGGVYIALGSMQVLPLIQIITKPLPIWLLIAYLWAYHSSEMPNHVLYNKIFMTLGLCFSSAGDIMLNLHDVKIQASFLVHIENKLGGGVFFMLGLILFLIAHIMYTICFSIEGTREMGSRIAAVLRFRCSRRSVTMCLALLVPVAVYISTLYWATINIGYMPSFFRLPVLIYFIALSIFAWRVIMRFDSPTLKDLLSKITRNVTDQQKIQQSSIKFYQIIRVLGAVLFLVSDSAVATSAFNILNIPRTLDMLFVMVTYYASQLCLSYSVSEYAHQWIVNKKQE